MEWSDDELLEAQRESLQHDRYKFRVGEHVAQRTFGEGVIVDFRERDGAIIWQVELVTDGHKWRMWCGAAELAKVVT